MWKILFYLAAVLIPTHAVPAPSEEIFNGDDAEAGDWPWMAAIYRSGRYRCGGTLISGRYVLTSAHCVDRNGAYTVVLGDLDRNSTSGDEQEVDVQEITIHPDYDDMTMDNDIAILRLNSKANTSNSNIGKIPRLSNTTVDTQIRQDTSVKCCVTGWGYETDDKGYWRMASVLQELEVDVIGNSRCDNFLLGQRNPSNVCYKAQNAGTCAGDSGSPLMCKVNKKWTLVGVHSFRINLDGCRGGAKAAARVSMYLTWISSIV